MKTLDPQHVQDFLQAAGLSGVPYGFDYLPDEPEGAMMPKSEGWSCAVAMLRGCMRTGKTMAITQEKFGCIGAGYHLGFIRPVPGFLPNYISKGEVPQGMEPEHYLEDASVAQAYYDEIEKPVASDKVLVFKPYDQFQTPPPFVLFMEQPEIISGLHQLVAFVTKSFHEVASPYGSGCGNLVAWPRTFASEGHPKAVLGGWDPSCRPFMALDALTLTLPWEMFTQMVDRWKDSFLTTETWQRVLKKHAKRDKGK